MSTPKNARGALTTSAADIYTAPEGGAKITMIQVTNVDTATPTPQPVFVTVQWVDSSASNAVTRLCLNSKINAGDSMSIQAGGLILEEGDKLQALASVAGDAEMTVSIIEG